MMAHRDEIQRIVSLVDKFASGERSSLADAQEIEVALDDAFPEDDEIQDFVTDFASYRPGGGEFLYGHEAMANKCQELRLALAKRVEQRG